MRTGKGTLSLQTHGRLPWQIGSIRPCVVPSRQVEPCQWLGPHSMRRADRQALASSPATSPNLATDESDSADSKATPLYPGFPTGAPVIRAASILARTCCGNGHGLPKEQGCKPMGAAPDCRVRRNLFVEGVRCRPTHMLRSLLRGEKLLVLATDIQALICSVAAGPVVGTVHAVVRGEGSPVA
jgi:hypothetical protein